jgi:hypothetical protein
MDNVTPPGVTNGPLWGSADGVSWSQLAATARLSDTDDVRADLLLKPACR